MVKFKDYVYESVRRNIGSSYWGKSRGSSTRMTGYAATLMGVVDNYKDFSDTLKNLEKKEVLKFLNKINLDSIGSEEKLYHGFQNKKDIQYSLGNIIKLPLIATSGDINLATQYTTSVEMKDQINPTLFEFIEGTKIVPYSMVTKKDIAEFGFKNKYYEALTSGEFEIVSERFLSEKESPLAKQYDVEKRSYVLVEIPIYTLKQIKTFNTLNGNWENV